MSVENSSQRLGEEHEPESSIIVLVEGDIEEDVPAELELFVRHCRLGLYKVAQEIYEDALEAHRTWFPVTAEYAQMLLDQGDFRKLELFIDDALQVEQFSEEELRLLRLLSALAKIHTKGLLEAAVTDSLAQLRPLVECTTFDEVQTQTQILCFRILEIADLHSSLIPGGLSGRVSGLGPWYRVLRAQQRHREADFVFRIHARYAGSTTLEKAVAEFFSDSMTRSGDEHSTLARINTAGTLFLCHADIFWNHRDTITSDTLEGAAKCLFAMMTTVMDLEELETCLSHGSWRSGFLLQLYKVDLLAMESMINTPHKLDLVRVEQRINDAVNYARESLDYATQTEAVWRMPLFYNIEKLMGFVRGLRLEWEKNGDALDYIMLLNHLLQLHELCNVPNDDLQGLSREVCRKVSSSGNSSLAGQFRIPLLNHIVNNLDNGGEIPILPAVTREELPQRMRLDSERYRFCYASQLFLVSCGHSQDQGQHLSPHDFPKFLSNRYRQQLPGDFHFVKIEQDPHSKLSSAQYSRIRQKVMGDYLAKKRGPKKENG